MNPPFSLKFKDLTENERENIQKDFPWKKSGVVDDIFMLKGFRHSRRYAFYIAFPGVAYRQSERVFREEMTPYLKELNFIENAFEDTPIGVLFLVFDKEKTDGRVYKEIYDCKTESRVHDEVAEDEEDLWQAPRKPAPDRFKDFDPVATELELRESYIRGMRSQIEISRMMCSLDDRLPPWQDLLRGFEEVIREFKEEK